MRKTFQLRPEGKHPDRVLDAVKHEIRKYLKRERARPLAEGVDFLDFDCRFGNTREDAEVVQLSEVIGKVDGVAQAGSDSFYLEILAKPGHRKARPAGATDEAPSHAS